MINPLQVFIAYSRKDIVFLDELRTHLRPLERANRATIWYDGKIEPGVVWEDAIKENLYAADIILLLLSADSIASDYFYEKEMTDALIRQEQGKARVIPLIVKSCVWKMTPLAKLQALPKDAKPVTSWSERDDAWSDVVESLLAIIEELEIQAREAKRRILESIYGNMIPIQGGIFYMGDERGDLSENCLPVHQVTLADFRLSKYPVTQIQWRAIMGSDPPNLTFKGCDDCPVEGVSWDDTQAFIQNLNEISGGGYRLPTEAEWEYAARGGNQSKGYLFSGSDKVYEVAWYVPNSKDKIHPVGSKKANELGLHDMSGSVWEWCQDEWYESYIGSPKDGSPRIVGGENTRRVIRGGAWSSTANFCRLASRKSEKPKYHGNFIGFRLAW